MTLLQIKDLYVSYGYIDAICGVSMDIEENRITAIIGSNGAGKTTIINAISAIVRHKSGHILLGSAELPSSSNQIVRKGVVQVPEGRKIFAGLSVEENLRLGAYSRHDKDISRSLEAQYCLFPILGQRRAQDAGTLSGGEQQMLAISRALMARPKLLMLDEPSLGLAPIIVNDVFRIIQAIKEQGTTVLLVEQNANKSLAICDYAYVLENGSVIKHGKGSELLADPDISCAYLGRRR
ncbi:MAG: ABC transporter ATP-binding protein [Sphaerochaetaceae bacterium]